ncbi:molecular chaperone TorD family protein [Helicobacter sp. MIT 21-1697]|uniref:molecular chaperone TorD family protein n=1 Tax=Helicobacter sp. MIT 21-1697 TaxID=2993733 RepID=UPI00224ACEE9|nr:molecular chaperone TorD family protein [Helicobacter sp. MIT 21-1697]MCX2717324.1 molecular chaperone TorD family protein [Helicobacter sp. MIT 21-1697]
MARDVLESVANARALYYDFFAGLFLYELLSERSNVLLKQVKILKENILDERDSVHFELLESELERKGIEQILREYTHTFILPFAVPQDNVPLPQKNKKEKKEMSNSQIMLYLSHYLEGHLNGKALLQARTLTKQSTFRLNTQECKESEEHLGFLLLLMRYLLLSPNEGDRALSVQVVNELVIPLGDFVVDALIQREDLSYYASVGYLLQSFLNVERSLK